MDKNRTVYGQIAAVGFHGHLMRDVSAGAVSCHHHLGEVAMLGQPGVPAGDDPLEGSPAVVVGGGEEVFWGAAVVDGDDENVGFGGEGVEEGVVGGGEGGLDAEAAAVEVDEDGEFLGWGRWFGEVDAGGDGCGGGDEEVFGGDAGLWVGVGGGDCGGPVEALDAAVLVDAEERSEIMDYFIVGIHLQSANEVKMREDRKEKGNE
eukprot:TRINITY_DN34795_c0_g2_i2.p2 TRINITY_DN34795_c0_g2~~TRINITY_DN34795_c0_g2_i2.p2  ORF type:complete len:205 (-),score=47.76 TRINITY_DN34795_c0_g2_i2:183-797(-)